jgi:hypothetical protein
MRHDLAVGSAFWPFGSTDRRVVESIIGVRSGLASAVIAVGLSYSLLSVETSLEQVGSVVRPSRGEQSLAEPLTDVFWVFDQQATQRSSTMKRFIPIVTLFLLATVQPLFAGNCNVTQGSTYNRAALNKALKCLNTNLAGANGQIAALKAENDALQADVLGLKGLVPPMGAVSMYEDAYVRIELTGAGKTIIDPVNHTAELGLRLLITNKTADILYLAYQDSTASVADDNGKSNQRINLQGIAVVRVPDTDGNHYSAVGAGSSITATWYCSRNNMYFVNFYDAHFIAASFGFVRYDYAGNTRFGAGFTGVVLP